MRNEILKKSHLMKQFRCSKRKLKRNRTQALENDTKSLEKKYKRIMDKSIRKHRKKIRNKIDNLVYKS